MQQAVMVEPGKIVFREVAKPVPKSGQVLVEMKRIGVCGSDIHVYRGKHPYTSYPVVQGHEVAGIIAELGDGVDGLAPGDQVTFMPQVVDGVCPQCVRGMYHICDNLKVMGFQTDGAAQEYFAVDAEKVLKVPSRVPIDQVAMVEPVSVAAHALRRGGGASGKKVLVMGAGTIGNLVAQVSRASGADAVMVTDISHYKLEKALTCGIDFAVNPSEEDLAEVLLRDFGPAKADLILECVGIEDTMTKAIENARKGTAIVVVGVFGDIPRVNLGLVQDRELSLIGTLMYQRQDYERAIELIAAGKLCLDQMITHRFQFRQYPEAYEAIEGSKGEYMKVMIEL